MAHNNKRLQRHVPYHSGSEASLDPARRLLAAVVVVRAVNDADPDRQVKAYYRETARLFLGDEEGQAWLQYFGIPEAKIRGLLENGYRPPQLHQGEFTYKGALILVIASLTGRVHTRLKFSEDSCQFSLKTKNGIFHIKASGREQLTLCQAIKQGEQIYVVGRPHSYIFQRCGSHHVYFEALTLLPVEQSADFQQMLAALTMQGCSVLKDTVIIEDIVKVHTVLEKFQADIFNVVFAQDVEGKTSQLDKDMRIDANTRSVFAHGHIPDMMISILNVRYPTQVRGI